MKKERMEVYATPRIWQTYIFIPFLFLLPNMSNIRPNVPDMFSLKIYCIIQILSFMTLKLLFMTCSEKMKKYMIIFFCQNVG